MKRLAALGTCIATIAVTLVGAQTGSTKGAPPRHGDRQHAVFVQTNEVDGNRILVFNQAGNGQLSPAGAYPTAGNGGVATPGTESDHLASQGSLVYDARHSLLVAVNAGSGHRHHVQGARQPAQADRCRALRRRLPREHRRLA